MKVVTPRRLKPAWAIYIVTGLLIPALIIWAGSSTLANAPSREAVADLGPYGLVTVRFSTDPSPALPTGTVTLNFMPMDNRQRAVTVDSLQFEYGREGSAQAIGSGQAQRSPDGRGMFMGQAQFPGVGNWWVSVQVNKADAHADLLFTFYVKPAQ